MKYFLPSVAGVLLLVARAHAADELPKIATLAELCALPVTHLATSWDVRVAYADPGPDAGPWTLLYCDARYIGKNPRPGTPEHLNPEDMLGPLLVKSSWNDIKFADLQTRAASRELTDGLYLTALPTAWPGRCHISVQDFAANAVAQKELTFTTSPPVYWHTFATLRGAAAQTFAAMPLFAGTHAIDFTNLETKDALGAAALFKTTLPGMIPSDIRWYLQPPLPREAKPDAFPLALSLDSGAFLVKTDGRKLIGWPDTFLLARWWVNDKPIEAPRAKEAHLRTEGRKISEVDNLMVNFGYPDALGAVKAGDKLALQVMYADGYVEITSANSPLEQMSAFNNSALLPLLSNKLEFTLTKELIDARAKNVGK